MTEDMQFVKVVEMVVIQQMENLVCLEVFSLKVSLTV